MSKITTRFIDQLLAPITTADEQADLPAYRKQIEQDMMVLWNEGMKIVRYLEARHTVAAMELNASDEENKGPFGYGPKVRANHEAYLAVRTAREAQCLIPAPTMVQLRWKQRAIKHLNVPAGVTVAIALDASRFAPKQEA